MTIKQVVKSAQQRLKGYENEAIFLLCEYLQKNRTWLFLNEDLDIDEKPYFQLVNRFKNGEPFEYIFEKATFWGLEFFIKKRVLIPRYDSEILLSKIIKLYEKYPCKKILEIGFGSGILSIIFAKIFNCKITACDINPTALEVAKMNAKLHKVEHLIEFKLCNFELIQEDFELIFSNPPYIKNDYKLDIWVQNEPQDSLFGGELGYEILEKIILFARNKNVRFLACEFGYDQKEIVHKILCTNNFKSHFFKDERNFDRVFVAIAKNEIFNEKIF
ncbi:peptide chain release factor N(5)-glutamine methyltransferase [Campylobacter sp. MIT 21-1685]|uniref:HemK/PrmC family methyltransferase n=1 Tax=unclassified Campylobacter TaxID=2593542 RepID=UPI00224B8671|nr:MULTISPECIES: HemK/PrmC family methyltransferase [unclassified Campylobacter]MCX2682735.1 peptide chain release factor N(5)-glutamine methyltransferase [Campylobacter sp. MIT 21-1684]MCX2751119.1 peptide chain release factor N(5)-glutamine methyltransferase [Campylobacter sp. MIT 21-1682]MCX2807216.1 peptide chain release factor N(5)-glutamine methyltransferase [Campylobacter sp. MIT 21-1685]